MHILYYICYIILSYQRYNLTVFENNFIQLNHPIKKRYESPHISLSKYYQGSEFASIYSKKYFNINNIESIYIRGVIFFAFPVQRLMITYDTIPIEIPSEIL